MVYDTFNQQTAELSIPEDCTELTIEAERYRSGKYGSIKWRYGITLLDAEGTEYYFSSDSFRGNQSEILKTMLQIKAFFFPESIEIKGVDQLENVIDFYKLSSEESAMLLELFG